LSRVYFAWANDLSSAGTTEKDRRRIIFILNLRAKFFLVEQHTEKDRCEAKSGENS